MKRLSGLFGPRRATATGNVWWRASQALAVALIVIGIAGADRPAMAPAMAQEAFPLDSYPGLGRSREAALRDDTIAAWEAASSRTAHRGMHGSTWL